MSSKKIVPTKSIRSLYNLNLDNAGEHKEKPDNIGIMVMGVPMMILNPLAFTGLDQKQAEDRIRTIEKEFFPSDVRYSDKLITYMAEDLLSSTPESDSARAYPHKNPSGKPTGNMIIMSHPETYTPERNGFMATIPFHNGKGTYPGAPEEHFAMTALHEVVHGFGANEVDAEHCAAQIHKREFGNNAFLKFNADVRAVSHILNTNVMSVSERGMFDLDKIYPWEMVEKLDQVIKTPRDELGDIQLQNKIAHGQQTKAQKYHPAGNIGFLLMFRVDSFENGVKATREMLRERSRHSDPDQRLKPEHIEITDRFILACQRLHFGAPAYTNSDDPYDIAPEVEKQAADLGQEKWYKRLRYSITDALTVA